MAESTNPASKLRENILQYITLLSVHSQKRTDTGPFDGH